MSNVSLFYEGVVSVVASTLGVTFKKLSHVIDLPKNKFDISPKRYGVLPSDVREVNGKTLHNTYDYSFEIILTDNYITSAQGDDAIIDKILLLQGKYEDIYRNLVKTNAGVYNSSIVVKTISDFAIEQGIILTEDKLIVLRGSITVRGEVRL